jgi:sugar phosphate isomerase/epimerase
MSKSKSKVSALFPDSRLLLSAGTLPKARFEARVRAASAAGFDAISLFPQQYLRARKKEKLSLQDMRDILSDNGVDLDEVDPLLDWFGAGSSGSEQLMFDMADALGARSINAAPAFTPKIGLTELTDIFAGVCERAATHGLRADLEFLPWSIVPDLATALDVVEGTGQDNAGIMLDCWHFFRGGSDLDSIRHLSKRQLGRITSIQVNDAPLKPTRLTPRQKAGMAAVMLDNAKDGIKVMGTRRFMQVASGAHNPHPNAMDLMNEASGMRLLPGEGDMPIPELLIALDRAGARPTVGLEVFSLDLMRKPAENAAALAMAAYRKLTNSPH